MPLGSPSCVPPSCALSTLGTGVWSIGCSRSRTTATFIRSGSRPMLRTTLLMVLAALGAVGQLAPALARDNPKNDPSKKETAATALQVGDQAPALKVTRWLQGD